MAIKKYFHIFSRIAEIFVHEVFSSFECRVGSTDMVELKSEISCRNSDRPLKSEILTFRDILKLSLG